MKSVNEIHEEFNENIRKFEMEQDKVTNPHKFLHGLYMRTGGHFPYYYNEERKNRILLKYNLNNTKK